MFEIPLILSGLNKIKKCPNVLEFEVARDRIVVQPYLITKAFLHSRVEQAIWDYLGSPRDVKSLYSFIRRRARKPAARRRLLERVARLIELRLLVEGGVHHEDMIEAARLKWRDRPTLQRLVIVPTMGCNLRCSYCFTYGNRESGAPRDLAWGDFAKAAGFFFENLRPGTVPLISFFGGEPLLKFDFMKKAVAHISRLERKRLHQTERANIVVFTNATLIDEDVASWFSRNHILVSISLDGPPATHDKCRVYAGGRGSHADSMRGIGFLRRAGVTFSVCITVGRHNIRSLPRDARWLVNNVSRHLIFNIMQGFVSSPNPFAITKEDYPLLQKSLVEAYNYIDRQGTIESKLSGRVGAFMGGEPEMRHCMACGYQIVIEPGGILRACHHLLDTKTPMLKVKDISRLFKSRLWRLWEDRNSLRLLDLKPEGEHPLLDSGGCPLMGLVQDGDMYGCSDLDRLINRIYLERCVQTYYYGKRSGLIRD
jgi:sulfatase maturation enzyme AslB (radical SAM superfamily)